VFYPFEHVRMSGKKLHQFMGSAQPHFSRKNISFMMYF